MISPHYLHLGTITRTSFTVSLACRDSLARTSGKPTCSTVDFTVCELRTPSDTACLGSVVKIVGALEVISYITAISVYFLSARSWPELEDVTCVPSSRMK